MESLLTVLATVGVLGFAWAGFSTLLSGISGWAYLARFFRDPSPRSEGLVKAAGQFGILAHAGVVSVGLSDEGLQLRVAWPFRAGHPPLLIPWESVAPRGRERGSFGTTHHHLELSAGVLVSFLGATGERILARVEEEQRRRIEARKADSVDFDAQPREDHRLPLDLPPAPAPEPLLSARESTSQWCPYCRDLLESAPVTACPHCSTPHHSACLAEHGGCVVIACRGAKARRVSS